jgi:hypothetical protein
MDFQASEWNRTAPLHMGLPVDGRLMILALFSFGVQIGFVAFGMARAPSSSLGRGRIVLILKCGKALFLPAAGGWRPERRTSL